MCVCARASALAIRETMRRARVRQCMLPQTPALQAGPFDSMLLIRLISGQSLMQGPLQRLSSANK